MKKYYFNLFFISISQKFNCKYKQISTFVDMKFFYTLRSDSRPLPNLSKFFTDNGQGILSVCFNDLSDQTLKVQFFYICVYIQVSIASMFAIYKITYVCMEACANICMVFCK